MKRFIQFFKAETVLVISMILALLSCIFTPIDSIYFSYLNFHVLSLLFSLMLIVSGLISVGMFDVISSFLLKKIKTLRGLARLLLFLCFFMSMFLTNDVILITLVPFTVLLLTLVNEEKFLLFILVFITIAANLGSSLLPFGNPQNLFLYTRYNFTLFDFIQVMLPYTLLSLFLLLLCSIWFPKKPLTLTISGNDRIQNKRQFIIFCLLFVLGILCVLNLVHYLLFFAITVSLVIVLNRKLFQNVDYSLLLTFVFFFIFVGNLSRISVIQELIRSAMYKKEVLFSVLLSQFISNVPCALLLSSFTTDAKSLLIGTNLGGLGTLIASMASLISFKFYSQTPHANTKKYVFVFTLMNVIFLGLLLLFYFLTSY